MWRNLNEKFVHLDEQKVDELKKVAIIADNLLIKVGSLPRSPPRKQSNSRGQANKILSAGTQESKGVSTTPSSGTNKSHHPGKSVKNPTSQTLKCANSDGKGHIASTYYKLVGYSPWHKLLKFKSEGANLK